MWGIHVVFPLFLVLLRFVQPMTATIACSWLCCCGRLALVEELHEAQLLVSPTTGNTEDFALEKLKDLAVALSL